MSVMPNIMHESNEAKMFAHDCLEEAVPSIPLFASSPTAASPHLPSRIAHSPDAAGLV